MKILSKITMLLTAAVALAACQNPEKTIVDPANIKAAEITSFPSENVILDRQLPDESQVTIKWNPAQYGYSAAVTYTLMAYAEVDGKMIKAELAQTSESEVALINKTLNGALTGQLNATAGEPFKFDVKLVCSIGPAQFDTISLPVKLDITTYSMDPIPFWVIGNYCGWKHDAATQIYSAKADGIYVGWVPMFDGAGATTPFKFSEAPDWDHKNYGGSLDALSTSADNISIEGGNVKLFTLDIPKLKAKVERTFIRFGMTGDATPLGWASTTVGDTEIPYVADEKCYKLTGVAMKKGELKFRADNGWDLSWGPGPKAGQLHLAGGGDGNIKFEQEPGIYTVIVNMFSSTITYEFIAE